MDKEGQSLLRRIDGIRSSLKDVFIALCHTSLSKFEYKPEYTCEFHSSTEHSINECFDFKIFLQNLMDRHILKVYHQNLEEEVFVQTGEELSMTKPKPLVIPFIKTHLSLSRQPVVIKAPSSFPYKNEKVIPWRYDVSVMKGEQNEEQIDEALDTDKVVIDNISRIGGITRSGRLFTPPELRKEKNDERSREQVSIEKAKTFLRGKVLQTDQEHEEENKKEITNEEACEFLRFIQQSEYKVVDQLNRMSARISLLELLMHSTSHRKLLI